MAEPAPTAADPVTTSARIAAFAASCGLSLETWQEQCLEQMLTVEEARRLEDRA